MDLLFQKELRIEKVAINNFSGDGTGQSHIRFASVVDTFSSKEPDVVRFALHIRKTIDSDGNYELVEFKDLEQYYRDIDFLLDVGQSKLDRAYRDLTEGRYSFDFDPDVLIEEFLLANASKRQSKKFLKLKSEHFHIAAYCAHSSVYALKQYEDMKAKTPGFETYYRAIEKIYMKSFRIDPNFVKNYIRHKTTNDFDLVNYVTQIRAITRHLDLLKTIYPKDGMPGDKGIQLLLDNYRRCAEACIKPLNLLRIGQEIANGNPSPARAKGAEKNKAILQPVLGSLLDCYDPRIRNSESHLTTDIDAPHGLVRFYKDNGGHLELLVTYSFVELVKMTNELQNNLFPALVYTAYMEWRMMLLVITLNSPEYKLALLKIDN